jgi:hypothetical protein
MRISKCAVYRHRADAKGWLRAGIGCGGAPASGRTWGCVAYFFNAHIHEHISPAHRHPTTRGAVKKNDESGVTYFILFCILFCIFIFLSRFFIAFLFFYFLDFFYRVFWAFRNKGSSKTRPKKSRKFLLALLFFFFFPRRPLLAGIANHR